MSVASPYAVFRAGDLGWPPVLAVVPSATPAQVDVRKARPRKRSVAGTDMRAARQPRWSALVQGELFPWQPQV
jgi:hypothetical protein